MRHSPKDWIHDCEKGRLSDRFGNPDNAWLQFWRGAVSCTAESQKPLFDMEKEAAKALEFLEMIDMQQLLCLYSYFM
jgi:hypothetical protein